MPLLSIYRASKAAVTALTEAAALELAEFGIRARVVVPGASPETNFGNKGRAKTMAEGGFPDAYAPFARQTMGAMQHGTGADVTTVQDVAEAVFHAATDPDCPMILPAGADAIALYEGR
jgi:NAD(P)-dependent dehydrogenase (short-subunit alcohol dehydrogenase family)